jgi:imidazole glycerol-phosphate synthase subunit HisH
VRVAILDTGAGNLHSLEKALSAALGAEAAVNIETDTVSALKANVLVLPGVGAFGPAAARLAPHRDRIRDALIDGLPAIGICLGMQLLFDESDEGPGAGLGVIPGRVTRLRTERTPHMGWTPVSSELAWLRDALPSACYFAHSFACRPADPSHTLATSEVPGDRFASIVGRGRTIGCQFHPEKSSAAGVALLGRIVREISA